MDSRTDHPTGLACAGSARSAARTSLVLVLGTVFAVLAGLLVFLVSHRTLGLVHAASGPTLVLLLGASGALVTSLYTSICLRIELDLGVALPAAAVGAAVLIVGPRDGPDLGAVLVSLLVASLTNTASSLLVAERVRWIGERFIGTVHHLQSAFLVGAVAWSFSDMAVRAALAAFGLIAWIGWHPGLIGGCALTMVEAKLDVARRRPELAERGFILCELEKRLGLRLSPAKWDRFVHSAALLLYAYWALDLLI